MWSWTESPAGVRQQETLRSLEPGNQEMLIKARVLTAYNFTALCCHYGNTKMRRLRGLQRYKCQAVPCCFPINRLEQEQTRSPLQHDGWGSVPGPGESGNLRGCRTHTWLKGALGLGVRIEVWKALMVNFVPWCWILSRLKIPTPGCLCCGVAALLATNRPGKHRKQQPASPLAS